MKSVFLAAILVSSIALATGVYGSEKLSPVVNDFLASSTGEAVKVWVYFTDRGVALPDGAAPSSADAAVSERSIERRARRSSGPLIDVRDLPVHAPYVQALRDAGCTVRHPSRYLNAVSVYATPDEIRVVEHLEFVRKVDLVQTARREIPDEVLGASAEHAPRREAGWVSPTLDYGTSYTQIALINVLPLHAANVSGEGVLIAMLDTGYNRGHESLIHLDVIAERDFINNDPVTENEPGDPLIQHNHGTYTLAALGGYAPGQLIGPAWAATFALGKTERIDTEIEQEEDDYVAGLEWADSLGAEIVSSSLGYSDWYTYADMDGNTAVTTIAADIAASKGIAVITAAGNHGPLPWPGIIAPSDGDSVIAVGAVDAAGIIASFSSRGPSYDGRIKPDVCAMGVSVYSASPADSLAYVWVGGTSLATPLVAGAAALCLQMHPYWSPIQLRDELRASADHAQSPNNDYGWGVIDAYQTALYGATGVVSDPPAATPDVVLRQNVPNPFIPSASGQTAIHFRVGPVPSDHRGANAGVRDVTLTIYDVSGRLVRRLADGPRPPGDHVVAWDGLDDRGIAVATGVYYYRVSVGGSSASKKVVLIRR
jgi:serine protease AprX